MAAIAADLHRGFGLICGAEHNLGSFPLKPDQPSPARPAQRLELPSNPARGRSCRANSPRHAPNQTKPAPPSKQLEPDHLPPPVGCGRGAPVPPARYALSPGRVSPALPPARPARPTAQSLLVSCTSRTGPHDLPNPRAPEHPAHLDGTAEVPWSSPAPQSPPTAAPASPRPGSTCAGLAHESHLISFKNRVFKF